MRLYIRDSRTIDNIEVDHASEVRGMMRIIMPAVMATAAIGLSFINTNWSLLLFLIAIFFNLSDSSRLVYKVFKRLNKFLAIDTPVKKLVKRNTKARAKSSNQK